MKQSSTHILTKIQAIILVCTMSVSVSSSLFIFPSTATADTLLAFVDSASSTTDTITVPSGAVAGDIAILFDIGFDSAGTAPTSVLPTGWTQIDDSSLSSTRGFRGVTSYRILTASDPGSSVVGINSQQNNKVMVVFRGVAVSVTVQDKAVEITNGNPVSQTANASLGASPLIVLAVTAGYDANGFSTNSPALTTLAPTTKATVGYLSYASSPSDHTVDTIDNGNANFLLSFYLEAVVSPDAPTNLVTTSNVGSVGLSWTAPASSGSSNLETYGVWRATLPFTATTSATLITSFATSTGTSYTDTSTTHGTVYYYRVTTTNQAATSSLSSQRSSGSNSGRIIRLGG